MSSYKEALEEALWSLGEAREMQDFLRTALICKQFFPPYLWKFKCQLLSKKQ